ncbi:murein biosynthesis integral membrane protein MurJ [Candidatus Roizmanbacteria bacterium RIFCSPHIGHO2_12_FULL_33_9]|uniref:Probable lipid II flippase MurJ n=1 Tax=Candidatus Roizmanbacteria bacterium RIFCSPHIGHO2_12_FULL_33_9 TaxID=1802045 RepID=A0A1F7HKR7_9BACT|nr:MAG: murein biosynthesis integral membrane protein MurJ [Candidatus Roizmanbacteria bacterium RIFCSPHIGHO2_12_FULL_33_9]
MNNLLLETKKFFLTKQKTIISSAVVVGVMILISRLFGFLRYRILAGYFNKSELDIFFASFRIPDFVFEILITGAVSSAFIPIFIKYQKDQKKLNTNISSIINIISLIFIAFVVVLYLLADKLIPLMTPGFSYDKIQIITRYSKMLLIGQLPFMIFASFLTGLGHANKIFLVSAIAPIAYNLSIIIATVLFAGKFHLIAPIIGVIFGSFLLFITQIPLLFNSGFIYYPVLKITKGLKEFFGMIIPRVVTVLSAQIDATVDLLLTSVLGAGSYTVFYLAQHLQLLPVSILGISFGQASLPYLSEIYRDKKYEEFKKMIIDSILSIFFLTIPITAFFIFARTPLVRLFFGGDKFDWDATVQTAITLSYFAFSIPFHSIYYFITRCFYAFLDSKTPFYISVVSIIINIIMSVIFIFVLKLPVWSLGISFSISITINVFLLLLLLSRKLKGLNYKFLVVESLKIFSATFISAFFVYLQMKILDGLIFDTTRTINVFFLLLTGALTYLLFYSFLSWVLGVKELKIITDFIRKARSHKKRVIEIYTDIE